LIAGAGADDVGDVCALGFDAINFSGNGLVITCFFFGFGGFGFFI
jgi:hypothetical protein